MREDPVQPEVQVVQSRPWEHDAIIGDAAPWKEVLRLVDQVADKQEVLLLGESGTGKELVAKAVHTVSAVTTPLSPSTVLLFLPIYSSLSFLVMSKVRSPAVKDRDGRFKKLIGELFFSMKW